MTSKLHRTSLAGTYPFPDGSQLLLVLEYPDNMGLTQALEALESYEQAAVVHSILGALFVADKTTRLVERGEPPEFLNGNAAQIMADLLSDQWEGEWQGEPPPLRSDEDLERMIREIPEGIFSGEHPKPSAMDMDPQTGQPVLPQPAVVRQFFPELPDLRPLDAVRLFWRFSKYLWSDEWWRSRRMQAYARATQGPYADILNRFAMLQAFSRPPVYSYRGLTLPWGTLPCVREALPKRGKTIPNYKPAS